MAELSTPERYSWSSREIELLIAMWDNEEVLYNTRCIDYFKRDKRIEALERLSDTLKIPIPEIRKKMTNLRTYYGKELWKEKKSQKTVEISGDPSKAYHSKWLFFKSLDFLRDNCNPKHVKNDADKSYDADENDNNNESTEAWDDATLLITSLESINGEKDDSKEDVTEELLGDGTHIELVEASSEATPQMKETLKLPEKRKRTGDDLESVIAKLRRNKPVNKAINKSSTFNPPLVDLTTSNPDIVFSHHVGLTLMSIKDAKAKDFAKLRIQQVLFEAQYGHDATVSLHDQANQITS